MRRHLTALAVAAGVALAGLVAIAAVAVATTGPNGTRVPRTLVPNLVGDRFTGRWTVSEIEKRSQITGGQISIVYTKTHTPYLFGTVQFSTVDTAGRPTTLVANLYPFDYNSATRKLEAKIYIPGSNANIGYASFDVPDDPDALSGTLDYRDRTYDITYVRADATKPMTADGSTAPDATATTPAGDEAASDGANVTGAGAGLYAPVVRAAMALTR